MANSIDQNPIIVDTASSTVAVTSSRVNIIKVIWQSGASGVAGDQLVLKNSAGKIILDVTIEAAKQTHSESWPVEYPLNAVGIFCTTLSHGTVYIYTAERAPFAA